jgi:fumarate reductase subunit C
MMHLEETLEVEFCQFPHIDLSYILAVVAKMLALYSAFSPSFYIYIDDEKGRVLHACLFTTLFEKQADGATWASFIFLLASWILSAIGAGTISNFYHVGFGEREEDLPPVSCCLSLWFSLVGTLGLLSLVALSSETCTSADICELSHGAILVIIASVLWFTCGVLLCATSFQSRCAIAKVHCDGEEVEQNVRV